MQIQERSQENLSKPAGSKPAFSLESQGLCGLGLNYGREVYRFRWLIIAFWVVVVIVSIPFAAKVGDVLQGGGYSYHNSESTRAENLISEKLNQPAAQLLVVFQSAHTPVNDPSFQKEVNDFMSRARSFAHVTAISPGALGQDGRTTYVTVNFNIHSGTVEDRLDDFRKLLPGGLAAGPAQTSLTGNPPLDLDFKQITQQDTEGAEVFALPLSLVVLLVVFGTLVVG